jgi:aminopeptidase
MVMAERYGIPSTKIISLMSAWKVPFRNVQTGDRLLVMTDDSMDPMVWQSAMAALQERGAEVTLALYPRRTYHCGDPTAMAVSAAKEADAVVALPPRRSTAARPACARSALKAAAAGARRSG